MKIIGRDSQREDVIKAANARNEEIKRIMHVRHEDFCSKPVLINQVVRQDKIIHYLYEQLFFVDPEHKVFKGMPKEFIADLVSRASAKRLRESEVYRGV
jgi:hypothetical protein